ncbi:SHOCT domain-containing protein [uncultured Dysosmobacter sp.]|uniref:SHOCT domain-containing protein n=1 Tax=uncultured Dysosmobacter sp. TaxID=2591384 RepID=UPI00262781E8|nr:SHOCT domain-containing protein [uncultured Dysosmobacter sp.]
MGLFGEVLCGVCGKKAGLTRYKTKDGACVCAECVKAGGGLMALTPQKMTVPEIRAAIAARTEGAAAATAAAECGDLQTAESMYQACKMVGFGVAVSDKWGQNHFRVIEKALMDGEKVLAVFLGLHNYKSASKHEQTYAYALTNRRLICGQQNLVAGDKLKTVYLDNLNDITVASGILNGTLTIDTMKETFSVFVGADPARKIAPKLHAEIDGLRRAQSAPASAPAAPSAADEIAKFKALLDSGAITEEEFSAKKKQLLGL